MIRTIINFFIFHGMSFAMADTVQVTVGDTGCAGRQNSVIARWESIPEVISVTVVPRQPKAAAAQRIFLIVSKAAIPTEATLRDALGRRAKHYPILKYERSAGL